MLLLLPIRYTAFVVERGQDETTAGQDDNTTASQVQKCAQTVPRQKYGSKKATEKSTFFACPTPGAPLYIGVSGANSFKLSYPAQARSRPAAGRCRSWSRPQRPARVLFRVRRPFTPVPARIDSILYESLSQVIPSESLS